MNFWLYDIERQMEVKKKGEAEKKFFKKKDVKCIKYRNR